MSSQKFLIFFIIAVISLSCLKLKDSKYYVKLTGPVEIIQVFIPDTVVLPNTAQLRGWARASNSCWSDLKFVLTENSDFEYSLEAYGQFESYGSCADITVSGDTVINFTPPKAGLYRFTVVKNATESEIDTMIVR